MRVEGGSPLHTAEVRRRGAAITAVAVVHLALILVAAMSLARKVSPTRDTRPLTVRLRPPETPRPDAQRVTVPEPPPPAQLRIAPIHLPMPDDFQVAAEAPADTGGPAQPSGGSLSAAASAARAASGPLSWRPSREVMLGSLANPAVMDPRANSPRPTAEERMVMAIDPSKCLVVDRLPDGTDRRRWGTYTEVVPAITQQTGLAGKKVRVCAA